MNMSKRNEDNYAELEQHFDKWEMLKDMTDQGIDIMLNLRQSGHPGGSRSKVHALLAMMLSGVMRWDIRNPERRFADKFILVAGHTVPVVYSLLATLNEAMRRKYQKTGDKKYLISGGDEKTVYWQDLLTLRHNDGLPGHAEMTGKTNFFKANTGPSGHGTPVAAGEAMALKYADAKNVRVFAIEGEGGLTAGVTHETLNSAYGLGLDNLYYLVDWNDYGIDDRPFSSVIYGTPQDWFGSHGWRVYGTEKGMEWQTVTETLLNMGNGQDDSQRPVMGWFKTSKGRGYGVFDNKSHGAAHKFNSPIFWETKKYFSETYGIEFDGFGQQGPVTTDAKLAQATVNMEKVFTIYDQHPELVDYVADRLIELAKRVPDEIQSVSFDLSKNPTLDPVLTDYENYPKELFAEPGSTQPNRGALSKWGAWVNAYCVKNYGRPLFLATSADLADSTNISGFGKSWDGFAGLGFYNRDTNPSGCMLPQGITEFANASITTGIAGVNFSDKPFDEFNGFYAASSTYGSFSYLKYGAMRLFSQLCQDTDIQVGKVIWVVGHSGPETAEDSRTHFGIYSPSVTQLFPEGHVINLYPWEHNEVAPMIAAAMKTGKHIIALHLTRPGITVPDRKALGMASHLDAAKGAYILRDYNPRQKKMGLVFIQGTSTTANFVEILPKLDALELNIKVIAAVSPQLFALQSDAYKSSLYSEKEWMDSTFITNAAKTSMAHWTANHISSEYAISADFDNNWRGGGSLEEVCEDAHISSGWLLKGVTKFVNDRELRLSRLRTSLED
jgi:transketolase